jgi:DNA polymerase-3 subunit delta
LIVIKNIFNQKNKDVLEQIANGLDNLSESTVIVFTQEGEPDKRLKLFKRLSKEKNSKYFAVFSQSQQISFVRSELKKLGNSISSEAIFLLVEYCMDDLWRLDSEIHKLADYKPNQEISVEDVEQIVSKNVLGNSFKFVDALLEKKPKIALDHLQALLDSNEPPLKILGLINYQFRTIAYVWEARKKEENTFKMSKMLGLKPFQIQKVAGFVKNVTLKDLSAIFSRLVVIDESIKSGKIEPGDALKDFVLGIDGNRNL